MEGCVVDKIYYEERQTFGWWVYAVALLAGLGIVSAFVVDLVFGGTSSLEEKITFAIMLPLLIFLTNMLYMITRVTDKEIFVQFGKVVPFFRARIPLADIVASRSVQYKPLRNAGGWGIRGGRFEGVWCRFYSVKGNEGVFVETEKRRYIIGSQRPEEFVAALEDVLKDVKI